MTWKTSMCLLYFKVKFRALLHLSLPSCMPIVIGPPRRSLYCDCLSLSSLDIGILSMVIGYNGNLKNKNDFSLVQRWVRTWRGLSWGLSRRRRYCDAFYIDNIAFGILNFDNVWSMIMVWKYSPHQNCLAVDNLMIIFFCHLSRTEMEDKVNKKGRLTSSSPPFRQAPIFRGWKLKV